ncbi:MAG TPA: glycerophosphodiester phosphodiesterase [Vicinamibacterales bacterium]
MRAKRQAPRAERRVPSAEVMGVAAGAQQLLIIGHRGASGHRPEHTLESYRLAAQMGADYIEPDLVSTRDGVLVARHENEIGSTTDVATKFPERKATKSVDGVEISGWFSEDFTLDEIRTLRARERLSSRSQAFDGQFTVPTFDEVVALARQLERELGRPIGVYVETKHPSYFSGIGLPLEPPLLQTLERYQWTDRRAPVFIQSFETSNLRELRTKTQLPLIQLLDDRGGPWDRRAAETFRTYADLTTDAGLGEIAAYANGIGPNRRLIVPAGNDGTLSRPTDLVSRAHRLGLLVHVWTLRSDPPFLSPYYGGRPEAEYEQFRDLGVDGIFTDFPDVAVRALKPR